MNVIQTDATHMFHSMLLDIRMHKASRQSADATSPMTSETYEAIPSRTYTLLNPRYNVPKQRSIDLRWATANVLHFFAATEKAAPLRKYNRLADKFLTGDELPGAYGAIAVPQIAKCIHMLRADPSTRRAYVSMGPVAECDYNRPACWCTLHFLRDGYGINMCVYQRSLNLHGVMPYDCIALTNILYYVSAKLGVTMGRLFWTVGNLHTPAATVWIQDYERESLPQQGLLIDPQLLTSSEDCWSALVEPHHYTSYKNIEHLCSLSEVRT